MSVTSVRKGLMEPGTVTSATRPTNPYPGQTIFETDTLRTLQWNGTMWKIKLAPWLAWSTANGHATNVASAVGSVNGGTNWGTTPTVAGRVHHADNVVDAWLRITAGGASISAGTAGTFKVNLPYQAQGDSGANDLMGHGFYLNQANTIYAPFEVVAAANETQADMYYGATYNGTIAVVSTAVPFALATGASLYLRIRYESVETL